MINLIKTLIALFAISFIFACEDDDPGPVNTQIQNEQFGPIDEEFDEYRRGWIEEKKDVFQKEEYSDIDSIK